MALNIGDINFNVDANTAGLKKAIADLEAFQKRTDAVAKSQQQGAAATAAAYARQESSIKAAFQRTLSLQQQLLRAKAPESEIDATTAAFERLTTELVSGKLSVVDYTRAVDAFTARIGRSQRALREFQNAARDREASRFTEILRDLESASVLAVGPLSGLGARIRSLSAIVTRSNFSIAALLGSIVAVTVGFVGMAGASIRAARSMEQMNARFLAASGSAEIATKQMAFVVQTARSMGLDVEAAGQAFSRLEAAAAGTAMQGKGTRDIFIGISSAAAALRLDGMATEGMFRAIEQMMSKGKVTAEELRGQLGERLPGAFRLAAESMGKTTMEFEDMLRSGQAFSDDFLAKFSVKLKEAFGSLAQENVNSFAGSLNELKNATFLFAAAFDRLTGISRIAVGAIQALTRAIDFMRENLKLLAQMAGAAVGAITVLAAPAIGAGIATVAKAIWAAAKATQLFNIALLANPIGGIVTMLVKLVSAIGGAVIGWFIMKDVVGDLDEELDKLDATLADIGGTAHQAAAEASDSFKTLNGDVQETIDRFGVLQNSLRYRAFGVDPNLVLPFEEALNEINKLNSGEVEQLSKDLSKALGREVQNNGMQVAIALAEIRKRVTEGEEAVKAWFAAWDDTDAIEATQELRQEVEQLQARLGAAKGGEEGLKYFDAVTSKVLEAKRTLEEANAGGDFLDPEQLDLLKRYEALLKQLYRSQDNYSEALEKARDRIAELTTETRILSTQGPAALEHYRAVTGAANQFAEQLRSTNIPLAKQAELVAQLTKALEEMYQAQKDDKAAEAAADAIKEISEAQREYSNTIRGGEAEDYYGAVTQRVNKFNEALVEAGVSEEKRNALSTEYAAILDATYAAMKRMELASQFSDAIVQGLENIIIEGENVKDVLGDILKEIARVALRAAILQPLQQGLTNLFSGLGGGFGGGVGAGGGGGTTGQIFAAGAAVLAPAMATGGSFEVPGIGGVDTRRISFMASPGERVTVRPPGSGGDDFGGGITIVNNIDARQAQSPAHIKAVVDLATEKAKNDIRDMIKRGRF